MAFYTRATSSVHASTMYTCVYMYVACTCALLNARNIHCTPTRDRGTPTSAHTEELALIICTLQIYNTTIHTSVGAETQEGRLLRGLAGWLAGCLFGRLPASLPLPLSISETPVSLPSPSFSLSLYPFLLYLSLFPPFQPVRTFLFFFLFPADSLRLLPCSPAGGQRAENRRAKYRATSGRGHLRIHRGERHACVLFLSPSLSFTRVFSFFRVHEAGIVERLPGDTLGVFGHVSW